MLRFYLILPGISIISYPIIEGASVKTITIVNNKGGTGKTVVAVHLAICLGRLGFRVLFVDNDTQSNATTLLLDSGATYPRDIRTLLKDPAGFGPAGITVTPFQGVHCIPNNIEASGLSLELSRSFPDCLEYFPTALSRVRENYDYAIIDCPPTLDIPMSMALAASDGAIVPVEVGSTHSMDGLNVCLQAIEDFKDYNPRLKFLKLVMNRADRRTTVSKAMIKDIEDKYPGMYFKTVLPICTAIQQAEYFRQPLHQYAPKHVFIKSLKALTKEVIVAMPLERG